MMNIQNLEETASVLEEFGYDVRLSEHAVHVAVGGDSKPFVAVLTIDSAGDLVITCQMAKLGDLKEDELAQVQFLMLDTNTRIMPFAFAIISASDNPEMDDAEEYPVVLIDSMPIGDLSSTELGKAMDSLLVAIETGSDALKLGL